MAAQNFQAVATEFVTYYYTTFDSNRAGLQNLYRANSMLTFEGNPTEGVEAIIEKLTNLPFTKVQHQVSVLDAHPAGQTGNILVLVTGVLLVDEEQRPMSFVQTFQLVPDSGSFYVYNDIFRLVYPAAA